VVCEKFIFSSFICGKFLKNTGFKRLKKYGGGGVHIKTAGNMPKRERVFTSYGGYYVH